MTTIDEHFWCDPWEPLSADEARQAELELARELCAEHILFSRPVKAIAHRIDRDDFLFEFQEPPPRYVVVHLTWRRETQSKWPRTALFESLDAWIECCFRPAVIEYSE